LIAPDNIELKGKPSQKSDLSYLTALERVKSSILAGKLIASRYRDISGGGQELWMVEYI
jgi:hypothetical protein